MEYAISMIIIFGVLIATSDPMRDHSVWIVFPLLYLCFAQGAKRCQDRDVNGLFVLSPASFFFNFTYKGTNGANKFGEEPNGNIMKNILIKWKNLRSFFERIYRLSLNYNKQEALVWEDLKKLHTDAEWRSGIYEKDKCIESVFEFSKEKTGTFFYMLYEGYYHCRVKILEDFPQELTTDFFILAAHFNNLLNNGVVIINVENQYVEYHTKREILIALLYTGEIYDMLIRHFKTSKDICWAFQRLVKENESPAIIIADLLKRNGNEMK